MCSVRLRGVQDTCSWMRLWRTQWHPTAAQYASSARSRGIHCHGTSGTRTTSHWTAFTTTLPARHGSTWRPRLGVPGPQAYRRCPYGWNKYWKYLNLT